MYLCTFYIYCSRCFLVLPPMNLSNKAKGHVAIFTSSLIFGVNLPLVKTLFINDVDPRTLTLFRMIGAAILFWISSLFIKKEHVPMKDITRLFLASILGIVINQFAFLEGLSRSSVIDSGILITMTPIFTMFLAAIFLKEPITFRKVLGVLTGMSGALLLVFSGSSTVGFSGDTVGVLLLLSSSIGFALYLTLFRDLISRYSPLTLMKWMFLFASIIGTVIYWPHLVAFDFARTSVGVYLKLGYVVVLATFVTYILIPIGQKSLRPTTLSMYNYVQPIVAAIIAYIYGMDTFGWTKFTSAILVFLGVFIVTKSKSRAQLEMEMEETQKKI